MSSIAHDIRRARLLPSRRALGRLLAFAATAVFLVLFLRQGSLVEAWQAIRAVPLWSVLAALASILAAVGFTALRWRDLLAAAGVEAPLPRVFAALAIGAAVNNVAPARAGDLVRIMALRERVAVPASAAAGTLVAERLLDGFTLALWIVLGSLLAGVGGPLLGIGVAFSVITALGIAAAALAAAAPDRAERLVARATRGLPERASRAVAPAAAGFLGGLAVFHSPRLLARAFAASLALWLADVGMYAALAHGFGLDLGVGGCFLLEGIGNLALAVPATAAGIGSFDYLTLLGAKSLGVGGATGAAYVLAVHAFVVLPMTILGGLLLPTLRKRQHRAQRGARGRRLPARRSRFRLSVATFNERAIRVYDRTGFRPLRTYIHETQTQLLPSSRS